MYYLNDKHTDFEYAIYCRVGQALPYIQTILNSMEDVMLRIVEIEKKHNHYGQFFYIDNDFYDNKYSLSYNCTYYKILRRPVSDWEEFTTNETYFNNVINFYR